MNEKQAAMFTALGEALRDSMPIDADRRPPAADFIELLRQLKAAEEKTPETADFSGGH